MTEVTKYIADDGTVFDTALECKEYETAFTNPEMKNVTFITSNHKEVEFSSHDDFFTDINKIIIHNQKEYDAFKTVTNFYGWYFGEIDQPGTWVYLDKLDKFINVDELIEDIVAQIKWERDIAMRTLADIGVPFGHEYKDITYKMGINSITKLISEGNARVIQTGGWDT